MPTVYVNDKPVEIGSKRLNCVQAAELAGVFVPHYCWHEALSVVASCRMCLVEVGDLKDGKVTMQPKVVPGCQTPVKDGTVIVTGEYDKRDPAQPALPYDPGYTKAAPPGERAKKSQADTLEGLLLNHPLDCPVCDKAGECKLQDFSYKYGRSESRMVDVKNTPPNKPHLSSTITLFTDRCILCTRCVRFTREISGTSELQVVGRGHHEEIDVFPGRPLENKLAGQRRRPVPGRRARVEGLPVQAAGVVPEERRRDVQPVRDRVQHHQRHEQGHRLPRAVPPQPAGAGALHLRRRPLRLPPREQRRAVRAAGGEAGRQVPAGRVERAPAAVEAGVRGRGSRPTRRASSRCCRRSSRPKKRSCSAATSSRCRPTCGWCWGPVPVVGADDTYPKNAKGEPVEPVKFTIRAEKAPNRRGVVAVLEQLQGEVILFTDVARSRCPRCGSPAATRTRRTSTPWCRPTGRPRPC
jgi:NADH-quinone oxidoreductase subunit G